MNRRKFLKQGLIISSLPLLPNIVMTQVRPIFELELFFNKLNTGFVKAVMAERNFSVTFEDATTVYKTLSTIGSDIEMNLSVLEPSTKKAKEEIERLGIYESA